MTLVAALLLAGGPLRLVSTWTAPGDLPFARIHGIAKVGPHLFVGGLAGLARRGDKLWELIDDRPVREVTTSGDSIWVLFGDGSVDKVEPLTNRLTYDVMKSASKRPWVASLAASSTGLLFGGLGGWSSRSGEFKERYPKELEGQVITSVFETSDGLWLGTQRGGLFQVVGTRIKRFGFSAGIPDSWVTALVEHRGRLVVGVADGGIVAISKGKVSPLTTTIDRVRKLAVFNGNLVVGGMDGASVQVGTEWQKLSGEETTSITVMDGMLGLGSPKGVSWWR
jgi:hypothetical protein